MKANCKWNDNLIEIHIYLLLWLCQVYFGEKWLATKNRKEMIIKKYCPRTKMKGQNVKSKTKKRDFKKRRNMLIYGTILF